MTITDKELYYIKEFILFIINKYSKTDNGLNNLFDELNSIGFEIIENDCDYNDSIGKVKFWAENDIINDDLIITNAIIQISDVIEGDPRYENAINNAYYVLLTYPLNKYIGLIRKAKIRQLTNGNRD